MVEQVSDFKMPEKVVSRLLKDALPEDVSLTNEAKNAACRCAGIFILQLSMAAAERAQDAKRRTLDNQDVIKAAAELGLSEYTPRLVSFAAQRKRNAKRKESNMHKAKSRRAMNLDAERQQPRDDAAESNEPFGEMQDQEMATLEEVDTPDQEPSSFEDDDDQYQNNLSND